MADLPPSSAPDGPPVALVTGASSGIGREVARLLAQRGYATVLIARRVDRLNELARELSHHAPSTPLGIDLSEPGALKLGIEIVASRHPRIDVLVNNAGFGDYRALLDQPLEAHRRLYEVNYFAAVALTRALLPGMIERRRGHVINIASMSTKFGPWGHGAYAGAKAALIALTQSLACEYASAGVHFSYVNPGVVRTEFFNGAEYRPLDGQIARHGISAQRVARSIVRLLDRPRLELCVPWYYRAVDWFRLVSPGLTLCLVRRHSVPPARAPGINRAAEPAEPGASTPARQT